MRVNILNCILILKNLKLQSVNPAETLDLVVLPKLFLHLFCTHLWCEVVPAVHDTFQRSVVSLFNTPSAQMTKLLAQVWKCKHILLETVMLWADFIIKIDSTKT